MTILTRWEYGWLETLEASEQLQKTKAGLRLFLSGRCRQLKILAGIAPAPSSEIGYFDCHHKPQATLLLERSS